VMCVCVCAVCVLGGIVAMQGVCGADSLH
jgi:hypothetical protein